MHLVLNRYLKPQNTNDDDVLCFSQVFCNYTNGDDICKRVVVLLMKNYYKACNIPVAILHCIIIETNSISFTKLLYVSKVFSKFQFTNKTMGILLIQLNYNTKI